MVIAIIIVSTGAYWYFSNKAVTIPTEVPEESATQNAPSELATTMPDCTLSAQPEPARWPVGQDTPVTLTWSSQNGTEAYAWHVVPMGGDIAIATIQSGKQVSLEGTETVVLHKRNDGFINYSLVVVNSEGAAICRFDTDKQFRTREFLDNPPQMG